MGKGTSSIPQAPAPVAPAATMPSKPPAAIPPVTERSIEVEAASRQTKIDAKKRKGMRGTLLAGETGGYTAPDNGVTKTLLG
jgi:hypothetical protein